MRHGGRSWGASATILHGASNRRWHSGSRASDTLRVSRQPWLWAPDVGSSAMLYQSGRSDMPVGSSCPPGYPMAIRADKLSRHTLRDLVQAFDTASSTSFWCE